MKRSAIATLVLTAAAGLAVWAFGGPATASESPRPWKDVTIAGAMWHGSFEKAKQAATEQGKPILHFQMFGKLDDALC